MELTPHLHDDAIRHGADQDKLYRLAGNANSMAMLRPMAAALQFRLEMSDGRPRDPVPPASTVTYLVVVHTPTPQAWREEVSELVLVDSNGNLPMIVTGLISREQSVQSTRKQLPASLSHLHAKLAGEYDDGNCVVGAMDASHSTAIGAPAGFMWIQIGVPQDTQRDAALRSLCFVASLLPQQCTPSPRLHGGAFEAGRTAARRVKLPSLARQIFPTAVG